MTDNRYKRLEDAPRPRYATDLADARGLMLSLARCLRAHGIPALQLHSGTVLMRVQLPAVTPVTLVAMVRAPRAVALSNTT